MLCREQRCWAEAIYSASYDAVQKRSHNRGMACYFYGLGSGDLVRMFQRLNDFERECFYEAHRPH